MNNSILHSIKSTAEILNIGRSSVYGLIAAGKINPVKIGRRTLIPDQSVQRFVAELVDQHSSSDDRGAS
jgi:excisionase family DNA binding protein